MRKPKNLLAGGPDASYIPASSDVDADFFSVRLKDPDLKDDKGMCISYRSSRRIRVNEKQRVVCTQDNIYSMNTVGQKDDVNHRAFFWTGSFLETFESDTSPRLLQHQMLIARQNRLQYSRNLIQVVRLRQRHLCTLFAACRF